MPTMHSVWLRCFWSIFEMRCLLSIVIASVLCCLGNSVVAQEKGSEKKAVAEVVKWGGGKFSLTAPETWKSVPPKSRMIDSEFRVPAEGDLFVRVTFSTSGGSIKENIDRWVNQFDGVKPEDTKTEKKEIGKATVHIVEVAGTYKDMAGGPMAPGPMKKLPDYRLLGAIIELADGTKGFVKATGPKDMVLANRDAFMKMLDGFKAN